MAQSFLFHLHENNLLKKISIKKGKLNLGRDYSRMMLVFRLVGIAMKERGAPHKFL